MTILSVNVNKIATLRNARGGNIPNVLDAALFIESCGVKSITVHPRPDERHIRRSDVKELKKHLKSELNCEGYPSEDFLELVSEIKPAQITLVPDPPDILTSNAGWDVVLRRDELHQVCLNLKKKCPESRISLFFNPFDFREEEDLKAAAEALAFINCDRLELFTGRFAHHFGSSRMEADLAVYANAAQWARGLGLQINAGHDLNIENLEIFLKALGLGTVAEVSIGHALICEALYKGLAKTIDDYQEILGKY